MLLIDTILLRPYVFVFLVVYLAGCSLHLGLKRAFLFSVAGYAMAWLSELSSIHNGFPYGHYYYLDGTRGKEIWVLGVPLMDSISYVFLAYASYSLALLVFSPLRRFRWMVYVLETNKIRDSLEVRTLGALLFVYLDIIIDPVALRGDRWFLGRIYGYPEQGVYFGVPLSNFLGWLAVGFSMIYVLQKIDRYLRRKGAPDLVGYKYPWRFLIGPVLYFGVLVFNLSVAFFIQEHMLGWVGIFIVLLPAFLIYAIVRGNISQESVETALTEHYRDFPQAMIGEPMRGVKRTAA
ncbi:MAG TPA: carotenoid biosynthesis protein [Nitrospirota bacterium]|nr:carotenoid biosynthesis protein [Nitrospirota bacterium]